MNGEADVEKISENLGKSISDDASDKSRKKVSPDQSPAKKIPAENAEKSPAKKVETKRLPGTKLEPEKSLAKKAEPEKSPAKKAEPEKSPAKMAEPEKSPAKKAEPEKSPATKAEAEKSPVKKVETKKLPAKKAETEKSPAKKDQTTSKDKSLAKQSKGKENTEPAEPVDLKVKPNEDPFLYKESSSVEKAWKAAEKQHKEIPQPPPKARPDIEFKEDSVSIPEGEVETPQQNQQPNKDSVPTAKKIAPKHSSEKNVDKPKSDGPSKNKPDPKSVPQKESEKPRKALTKVMPEEQQEKKAPANILNKPARVNDRNNNPKKPNDGKVNKPSTASKPEPDEYKHKPRYPRTDFGYKKATTFSEDPEDDNIKVMHYGYKSPSRASRSTTQDFSRPATRDVGPVTGNVKLPVNKKMKPVTTNVKPMIKQPMISRNNTLNTTRTSIASSSLNTPPAIRKNRRENTTTTLDRSPSLPRKQFKGDNGAILPKTAIKKPTSE